MDLQPHCFSCTLHILDSDRLIQTESYCCVVQICDSQPSKISPPNTTKVMTTGSETADRVIVCEWWPLGKRGVLRPGHREGQHLRFCLCRIAYQIEATRLVHAACDRKARRVQPMGIKFGWHILILLCASLCGDIVAVSCSDSAPTLARLDNNFHLKAGTLQYGTTLSNTATIDARCRSLLLLYCCRRNE